MPITGKSHLAQNLWKSQNNLQLSRFDTYKTIFEEMMTEVFYHKSLLDESMIATPNQCFIHREIPSTYIHAQPFYDRKECVKYIINLFREQGFFCKSSHNETRVFVSWYPKHLSKYDDSPQLEETTDVPKIKTQIPRSSVSSSSTYINTNSNFIELDGKQNSLQNRLKLSAFLLQQKQKEKR